MTPSDFRTKNCWTHDLTNLNCVSELSRDCLQTVGTSCWVPYLQLDRVRYVPCSQTGWWYVVPYFPHRGAHRPRGKAGFASQDCSDSAQATLSTSTAGTSCYVPYSQTDSGTSYRTPTSLCTQTSWESRVCIPGPQ